MSITVNNVRTFVAGAALEAFRLVKLSAANTVAYVGAGENAVGVTLDKVASGAPVSVQMLGDATVKLVASDALTVNTLCYAAADGKISAASPGSVSGLQSFQVLTAASGDGSVIEAAPISEVLGYGAQVLRFAVEDANTDPVTLWTAPYTFRIVDYHLIARDTTAANVTVKNDGTAISAAVLAKGTADNGVARCATLKAEVVAAGDVLTVEASAVAEFDVVIFGYRV